MHNIMLLMGAAAIWWSISLIRMIPSLIIVEQIFLHVLFRETHYIVAPVVGFIPAY